MPLLLPSLVNGPLMTGSGFCSNPMLFNHLMPTTHFYHVYVNEISRLSTKFIRLQTLRNICVMINIL